MDDEAHDYCHHIQSQLPSNHFQIGDGDDLPTDETGNTNGRVPGGWLRGKGNGGYGMVWVGFAFGFEDIDVCYMSGLGIGLGKRKWFGC